MKNSIENLELHVPDYLNGYVSSDVRAAIDAAMERDAEFKRKVELERSLAMSLRNQELPGGAQPEFDVLEQKIRKRQSWLPSKISRWSVPSALGLMLLLGVGNWSGNQVAFDDFETLSSSPTLYQNTTLRVIGEEGVTDQELRELLGSYELELLQQFPSLKVYDVVPTQNETIDSIVEKLNGDRRVRFVRVVNEKD